METELMPDELSQEPSPRPVRHFPLLVLFDLLVNELLKTRNLLSRLLYVLK